MHPTNTQEHRSCQDMTRYTQRPWKVLRQSSEHPQTLPGLKVKRTKIYLTNHTTIIANPLGHLPYIRILTLESLYAQQNNALITTLHFLKVSYYNYSLQLSQLLYTLYNYIPNISTVTVFYGYQTYQILNLTLRW